MAVTIGLLILACLQFWEAHKKRVEAAQGLREGGQFFLKFSLLNLSLCGIIFLDPEAGSHFHCGNLILWDFALRWEG